MGDPADAEPPNPVQSPWRTRDFLLVWSGGFVNNIGDWLLLIALPVYVFIETGSGAATSILFVVELLAALILGPIGGSLVDRWDLRLTLIGTNLIQAAVLLPLLTVSSARVWPAYLVVGAQAMLMQINNPASVALLPRVVSRDQLTVANAAYSTSTSLARLVGAPLGGFAVALGGLEGVVAAAGTTFLVGALVAGFLRADTAPFTGTSGSSEATGNGVRAGLMIVIRRRPLRNLVLIDGMSQVAQGLFLILFVVFVVEQLGGGGAELGVIRGSLAIGAIAGAALIGKSANRLGPVRILAMGYLGMGMISLLFWNAPAVTTDLYVYLLVFAVAGVPGAAIGIGVNTLLQLLSPREMLGRVVGFAGALGAVARSLGAIAGGLLVEQLPLVGLLDSQAFIYIVSGVLAIRMIRYSPSHQEINTQND